MYIIKLIPPINLILFICLIILIIFTSIYMSNEENSEDEDIFANYLKSRNEK